MAEDNWPPVPEELKDKELMMAGLELYKTRLKWKFTLRNDSLERSKSEVQNNFEREKADFANEFATFQAVNQAYVDAAKDSMSRSIERASFIEKASGSLVGLYTGLLALTFAAAGSDKLGITGFAPAIFLGLAFVLAAVYIAFIVQPGWVEAEPAGDTLVSGQIARRNTYILWITEAVLRRRYFLQAAVISLGVGLVYLPAPYIEQFDEKFWELVGAGLIVTFVLPWGLERLIQGRDDDRDSNNDQAPTDDKQKLGARIRALIARQ